MKLRSPYKCDYCGKLKEESNRWWLRDSRNALFVLFAWESPTADSFEVEHICGQECASKALAKWMAAHAWGIIYMTTPQLKTKEN